MRCEIVCRRGPQKGTRWIIAPLGLKIGRAKSCEIQVEHISVDLFHCVVKLIDGTPVVQNLASDTGVDVNGLLVHEARLKDRGIRASRHSPEAMAVDYRAFFSHRALPMLSQYPLSRNGR